MILSTACGTYSIVTCVLPSGRNHRRSPFLRASVNFFPDVLTSSVSHHSRARTFLMTSANVKITTADVDSTCNVRTLLVDANGACRLQIGIESPLRARSSIFVRNASLVAPSCASYASKSACLVYRKGKIACLRLTPNSELSLSSLVATLPVSWPKI